MLDQSYYKKTDEIIAYYGKAPKSLIPIMQDIQAEYRYLPAELLSYVAEQIGIPESKAYGVATFYENFSFEAKGKYVDKEGLRRQLESLKESWPSLSARIREQILPFEQVRENLRRVGAPYEPEMIGISRERFRKTVSYIPFMRNRFTNIDVIYRLGWMDEFIERMFGKGGIWEVNV